MRVLRLLTAGSQAATSHETGDNAVPCVLLLPPALDGAIERGEHATPNTKVATRNGRTSFDGGQRTNKTLALKVASGADEVSNLPAVCRTITTTTYPRRVPCSLDAIPDRTTNGTHGECTTKVV
jgi:hypothetical protein